MAKCIRRYTGSFDSIPASRIVPIMGGLSARLLTPDITNETFDYSLLITREPSWDPLASDGTPVIPFSCQLLGAGTVL